MALIHQSYDLLPRRRRATPRENRSLPQGFQLVSDQMLPQKCKWRGCQSDKEFTSRQDFHNHILEHKPSDATINCKWSGCDSKGLQRSGFHAHIQKFHSLYNTAKCTVCDKFSIPKGQTVGMENHAKSIGHPNHAVKLESSDEMEIDSPSQSSSPVFKFSSPVSGSVPTFDNSVMSEWKAVRPVVTQTVENDPANRLKELLGAIDMMPELHQYHDPSVKPNLNEAPYK